MRRIRSYKRILAALLCMSLFGANAASAGAGEALSSDALFSVRSEKGAAAVSGVTDSFVSENMTDTEPEISDISTSDTVTSDIVTSDAVSLYSGTSGDDILLEDELFETEQETGEDKAEANDQDHSQEALSLGPDAGSDLEGLIEEELSSADQQMADPLYSAEDPDEIITGEDSASLTDPTVTPEGKPQTGRILLRSALRTSYTDSFADQLSGFAREVYDKKVGHLCAGKTSDMVLNFERDTSPYFFDAYPVYNPEKQEYNIDTAREEYIAVRKQALSDMQAALDAFVFDHPEVFWTRQSEKLITDENGNETGGISFGLKAYKNEEAPGGYTGYISRITYRHASVFDGAADLMDEFNAKVDETVSALKSSSSDENGDGIVSDLEYIYAAHQFICNAVSYGNPYGSSDDLRAYCPCGVFLPQIGTQVVCEGYARAFKILCDKGGVKCACISGVSGNGVSHMWNNVFLNGAWYQVDVTWDDADTPSLKYFMTKADDSHTSIGDISRTGGKVFVYPVLSESDLVHCFEGHSFDENNVCIVCGYVKEKEETEAQPASEKTPAEDTKPAEDQKKQETKKEDTSFKLKLKKTVLIYNGKKQKPAVTVYAGNKKLTSSSYTITYSANKNMGFGRVNVKGRGKYAGWSGTASFKIIPRTGKIRWVRSTKKKRIYVKWVRRIRADGYEVCMAYNRQMTKGVKTIRVPYPKKFGTTIKGLKSGKRVYIKVRAFKTASDKTLYGKWSSVKSVKVR